MRRGTARSGAVACDAAGNLAAATSTGGMTGKLRAGSGTARCSAPAPGRMKSCAVSATGHGEFFIRYAAAHEIAARCGSGGDPLLAAAEQVVARARRSQGGSAGLIAVDAAGDVALPFNGAGMYGRIGADGSAWTGIFAEPLEARSRRTSERARGCAPDA